MHKVRIIDCTDIPRLRTTKVYRKERKHSTNVRGQPRITRVSQEPTSPRAFQAYRHLLSLHSGLE